MKHHKVFISYSSKNVDVAKTIYDMLESSEIPCWMAPQDLIAGEDYSQSIENAIKSSDIIIFVFSKHGNKSRWVKSELSVAFSEQKLIIPFKIDNSIPEGIVRMVLTKSQWIDALNESNEHYANLLERVVIALNSKSSKENIHSRFCKLCSSLNLKILFPISLILILCSKYVNSLFLLLNDNMFYGTYPEMTLIMTFVSIVASISICIFLKNEGRKWNKIVLSSTLLISILFFAFWEIFRCIRYNESLNLSFLGDSPLLLIVLLIVMSIPAIASYHIIIRRSPGALFIFFFYLTILFGIRINSPWTIISTIPIVLIYLYLSYKWYKKISNFSIIVLLIIISIYIGMNFTNYTQIIY